ncbi:hypothetical protein GCM10022247_05160 [Allokutzneria multivorans]|uniref:Uncharacterized protein n=1 Tax=Allokutzneria multivorans TaxID=1142134 RepID=A0ABP7QXH6_9PSEU
MWFRAAPDFASFVAAVVELFALLENERADGSGNEPFPHYARQVTDLSAVNGAYEVRVLPPEHLPQNASDEMRNASALLQGAVLDVIGQQSSARFFMDVGLNGSTGGRLAANPKPVNSGFALDLGFEGSPSDLAPVRQVLDALQYSKDLVAVYYGSGHSLVDGRIWEERPRDFAFPNWSFEDFSDYHIEQEKPPFPDAQRIHAGIARNGDRSLFAWVVNRYQDGWLICDDGPGETADFIHIAGNGDLAFIQVKGAKSRAPARRVALGAFEVVVSQALKNLVYTDRDLLLKTLSSPCVALPACWNLGARTTSRSEFLEALQLGDARNRTDIVIVQPHMSQRTHQRLRGGGSIAVSDDLLRLRLLEDLLNSARSAVTEVASDLTVVGGLT